MILVCAWCSSYLGEKEPFDVVSVSHSVCEDCLIKLEQSIVKTKGVIKDDESV